jgi:hypothetical protein
MSQGTNDWGHLMVYGYAPGSYMGNCFTCQQGVTGLDKRATRCRPCAERLHADQSTVRMLSRTEVAQLFAVQHAQALLSDDQLTGDASDGCGESPDGSDE